MSSAQSILQQLIEVGKTQSQIAAATGISQATISRILKGKHADPRSSSVDSLRSFAKKTLRRKKA